MEQLPMFEPPPFAPVWPASGLGVEALRLLLAGQTLDHPTFERKTGSWRLAAYIRELRAGGWPIESSDHPDTLADGRLRYVARYRLTPSTVAMIRAVTGEPASDAPGEPMPPCTRANERPACAFLGACHA